ncbi:efflux RND transporter periplasmic adaptor subunit [Roseibacillus persicicus]|uniref:Secretion protein HlyD n=1 Tax=Roseibacillus persicicus TaxID=454148 RepID=A0A918TCA5_9BACT|nr:efflux RND transporter periplasmic adaptor subunit [Roseibacillus persicicus]GHC40985.1 secretion protein HlyD [Roseibacillus persicicus]
MKKLLINRLFLGLLVFAGILVLLITFSRKKTETQGLYHTVSKADLIISIVEGGTIEAVNEVVVKNTIDGESQIIYLIPEGSYVKEGDLLVEFDKGQAESSLQEAQVKFETHQAEVIKATNDLIITRSTVDSELSAAKLAVQFAEMDRQKFQDLDRQHRLRSSELAIDTEAEALKLAQQRYEWSEKLAEKGFETKSQVDRDRLEVSKSSKAVETAQSTFEMLKEYDLKKEETKFLSDLKEAQAKLERTRKEGESKIAQQEAAVNSAKSTLRITEEQLERFREQLNSTKLYAPQNGLVIYAKSDRSWDNEPEIAEGSKIRNRRDVIKIPDTSKLKVQVKIHESTISQIQKGQRAYVVLDSQPDRRFLGKVTKVAILPDSNGRWGDNKKVYTTEIEITDPMEGVKPGVSARAEIIIEELKNVFSVPIQAVTTQNGKQVCYLKGDDQPTEVEVGLFNTKYIEIRSGLHQGDKVSLDPPLDDKLNLSGETTGLKLNEEPAN